MMRCLFEQLLKVGSPTSRTKTVRDLFVSVSLLCSGTNLVTSWMGSEKRSLLKVHQKVPHILLKTYLMYLQ